VARLDDLRLMAKVARMYYEGGQRQPQIAERLSLSQATVSRLLRRAEREGIVRITVSAPPGAHPALEAALEARFGLKAALVVDSLEDEEEQVLRDLGAAAAHYVETTIRAGEVVGIDSYASLRAMESAMQPRGVPPGIRVVQLAGGAGNPAADQHATQLTRRLAVLLRGEAVLLPAPGLAASAAAREVFLQDPYVRAALHTLSLVTLALVGIGAIARAGRSGPSYMDLFSAEEKGLLDAHGAVGFICHRFFDGDGQPIVTELDRRITAMTREQLARVNRVVGISGGPRRLAAIRAALLGRWVNVLITDRFTAERLLTEPV
jgi:DNA-binding transcriptional regulator LsrR (DeoR family)